MVISGAGSASSFINLQFNKTQLISTISYNERKENGLFESYIGLSEPTISKKEIASIYSTSTKISEEEGEEVLLCILSQKCISEISHQFAELLFENLKIETLIYLDTLSSLGYHSDLPHPPVAPFLRKLQTSSVTINVIILFFLIISFHYYYINHYLY